MEVKTYINRSSGGGLITLSSSTLGLQYSCELGEYVPRVARFFLAIITNTDKEIRPAINSIAIIGTTIKAISTTRVPVNCGS